MNFSKGKREKKRERPITKEIDPTFEEWESLLNDFLWKEEGKKDLLERNTKYKQKKKKKQKTCVTTNIT